LSVFWAFHDLSNIRPGINTQNFDVNFRSEKQNMAEGPVLENPLICESISHCLFATYSFRTAHRGRNGAPATIFHGARTRNGRIQTDLCTENQIMRAIAMLLNLERTTASGAIKIKKVIDRRKEIITSFIATAIAIFISTDQ